MGFGIAGPGPLCLPEMKVAGLTKGELISFSADLTIRK
jgi:hypothetical protein